VATAHKHRSEVINRWPPRTSIEDDATLTGVGVAKPYCNNDDDV
jgi:hypothetical protein